eukprot:m.24816 g.24816  ORF g.24816 m.24816 type:complete len:67 (+) comp28679_c0_seq1:19-219(+)
MQHQAEDEEEDPFDLAIKNSGCASFHYRLQDCMAEHRDWRKCQQDVKEFQKCIEEQKILKKNCRKH